MIAGGKLNLNGNVVTCEVEKPTEEPFTLVVRHAQVGGNVVVGHFLFDAQRSPDVQIDQIDDDRRVHTELRRETDLDQQVERFADQRYLRREPEEIVA